METRVLLRALGVSQRETSDNYLPSLGPGVLVVIVDDNVRFFWELNMTVDMKRLACEFGDETVRQALLFSL